VLQQSYPSSVWRIYKQRIKIVIRYKCLQSNSKLTHIIDALNSQCSSFGLRNSLQQKRGKNCDDGSHHQKFNQREREIFFIRVQSVFHPWLKII